jgi:hypothetical protein
MLYLSALTLILCMGYGLLSLGDHQPGTLLKETSP